jgi:hypothetical protein
MTDLIHAFHIPQLVDLALAPMADPHIADLSVKASAATATRSARKSAPARARARPAA